MTAMATQTATDLPDLIRRYADGEQLQALAKEAGVHRVTLYRWMLGGLGDKHHADLVTDCLVARISEADAELEGAVDSCSVTRAHARARFARMDLERRRPNLYGAKQEVSVSHSVSVDAGLVGLAGDLLRRRAPDVVDVEALPVDEV